MEFEYRATEEMPFDIKYPKGYENWIRETLPAFMFYDRFKKVMHCTRCGYTGDYTDKIRKGDYVICPHCKERLEAMSHTTTRIFSGKTLLHFWKTKKAIYYAEVWAAWEYRYIKPDSFSPKDYSQMREQEENVHIVPLSVGRFSREKQQAWYRSYTYGREWQGWAMREMSTPHLEDQGGYHILYPNTEKVLSKTFINIDRYENYKWPSLLIKELALCAKHPAAEYIVKAGLGDYIQATISDWRRTYIRPNWKAKTLPGFLRIKAQDIDKLRKWDRLDVESIAYYKKLLNYRKKPQLEELELVSKWLEIGALYSGRIKGDAVKLARYFEKQFEKGRYQYDTWLINEYTDYERMIDALGYPIGDDYYRYPKDLKEAHDAATAEYNEHLRQIRQREAAEARKKALEEERLFIESILPKLQKYNMQDGKYLIRALESVEDFKQEGINNHNCVGTYADRALKGKAKIFVLRKAEAPEISFVTIELALDEKSIKQCYGRGNSIPDEEVKAWVDHWLKTVVKGRKKRKENAA